MTTTDEQHDFLQWTEAWQAGGERDGSTEDEIRQYVRRRSRFVLSFLITDLVIGGIALPVLIYLSVATDSDVQRFSMLMLASLTIAAVGFGWWNWSGVLNTSATTIAAHLDISAERLRRMRLASRIAWLVLVAEVAIFTFWIQDRLYRGPGPVDPGSVRFAWAWLAGFTLAAIAGLLKFGRWLRRDAERLETLCRDYTDASTSVGESTRISSPGSRLKRKPRRPPLT